MMDIAKLKALAEEWRDAFNEDGPGCADQMRLSVAIDEIDAELSPEVILALISVVEAAQTYVADHEADRMEHDCPSCRDLLASLTALQQKEA